MHTLRFGSKLNLPSTFAIKHQIRKLMAEDEIKIRRGRGEVRSKAAAAAAFDRFVSILGPEARRSMRGHLMT